MVQGFEVLIARLEFFGGIGSRVEIREKIVLGFLDSSITTGKKRHFNFAKPIRSKLTINMKY